MYKKRRASKSVKSPNKENNSKKQVLNTIDEDTSIKIARKDNKTPDNTATTTNAVVEGLEECFGSEEHVPASQEPSQRYLSQRSTIAASLARTQSRPGTYRPPNTYFELVLTKAGVQLEESENFVLSCDHVAIVGKFRTIFEKSQNYPDNVQIFKTGLCDALGARSKFTQKLLSGCTISVPGEDSIYQSQDSMIVNFLMIDFLRDHVLEVLLDKIEEAACSSTTTLIAGNIPMLPLLLAQLRYVALSHGDTIYSRIKFIFEKATDAAKWDLIASAEFILDSTKHDQFVQMLLDNVAESKDIFNNTTLQTLTNLCLSAKMHGRLRGRGLAFIKDNKCPATTLPVLVKFLLKILNEDHDDSVRELVNTMREILIWRTNSNTATEKQSQLELFNFIEQALIRSKKFYYMWQKTIASLPGSQFRSVDFLILLLLIHIKEENSLYIENILRRRIKLEHITVDILNEAKAKYVAILEQHNNIIMQILHDFLKEKNKNVADFARAAYSELFQICESIQKSILKKLLELTSDKSTHHMTNLALELLRDLQRKFPKDVQNWGMLLMPLLDRLNEMSLSQTRLVMELLCSIAFPAPELAECPVLQDQIDMLVKKQIINRTAIVKKQGIIGSVQLIDSIARIEETCIEMDDFNTTFSTVSDLPDGRGKIAANYIVRVQASTMQCPESLALFYDELATVCAAPPSERTNDKLFDKPFLIWLCELITYYFQNSFVAEHTPVSTFGINLSYQKCINTIEDTNTEDRDSELIAIAINISELVLKPPTNAASSILVLAPLFNLLRVLHLQRYEGSLEQINALLGCAIILPSFFDDPNLDMIFYDYEEHVQKKILDIYFHCVNWIRETVSSFATQNENTIRNKVLRRLAELISIENKIRLLLMKAPYDYVPPMCQFISVSAVNTKPDGRGRPAAAPTNKKPKPKTSKTNQPESENLNLNETNANHTNVNDTIRLLAAAGGKSKGNSPKPNFDSLYGPKEIYRQMGSEVMLIMREKLNIKFPLPTEEVGKSIGLQELRFILTDLVGKLESVTGIQKFQTNEQVQQYIPNAYYFISDLSKFLCKIMANMEIISVAINEELEKVERVYSHANLFTEEFNYLKVCFGLGMRLLAAYFSWSEFADTTREKLLKASFEALLEQNERQATNTAPQLAAKVFKKFMQFESAVVDLKTCVHFHGLVSTLRRYSAAAGDAETLQDQALQIRTLCKTLLCRKWFNYDGTLERGGACNIYLDILVKGFLRDSAFHRQREILRIVYAECKELNSKENALKSFPNFKKANFPLLFRNLCEALITALTSFISSNEERYSDKLKMWEKSCTQLNMLLEILQTVDVPRNFQIFSKYAHLYLKLVLQHGLQVFEQYLRQNPERVNGLLKELQTTTRFLHNLCCHSKALKNTAIVSQIPFLRETLENLVFRVKALLAANKCASVFWMGNLLNKDLQGDEILSQSASLSSATGQNSDEDIPEDDVSVDETILGNEEQPTGSNLQYKSTNNSKDSSRSKCF